MALRIYTSADLVPKDKIVIVDNESHFLLKNIGLIDNEIGHKIIEVVEGGSYVDTDGFIGKYNVYAISSFNLSTGSKTLFNILGDVEDKYCFDTLSCGENAIQFALDMLDGYIIMRPTSLAEIIDTDREYYINDKRVYNDDELAEVLDHVKSSR